MPAKTAATITSSTAQYSVLEIDGRGDARYQAWINGPLGSEPLHQDPRSFMDAMFLIAVSIGAGIKAMEAVQAALRQ